MKSKTVKLADRAKVQIGDFSSSYNSRVLYQYATELGLYFIAHHEYPTIDTDNNTKIIKYIGKKFSGSLTVKKDYDSSAFWVNEKYTKGADILMSFRCYDTDGIVYEAFSDNEKALEQFIKVFEDDFKILDKSQKDNELYVNFWNMASSGPQNRNKTLVVDDIKDILSNYSKVDAAKVLELYNLKADVKQGKLIILSGEPGTGKSTMLRTVLAKWQDWAEINYITDPITLFGGSTSYLNHIIFNNSTKKWRIFLLEDVGELLLDTSKDHVGQGLGQLLNTSSGFIGEGNKTLFILTTNDKIKSLSGAISRPGRALMKHEFSRLDVEESNAWLKAHDSKEVVTEPSTIAELYAQMYNSSVKKSEGVYAKTPGKIGF